MTSCLKLCDNLNQFGVDIKLECAMGINKSALFKLGVRLYMYYYVSVQKTLSYT